MYVADSSIEIKTEQRLQIIIVNIIIIIDLTTAESLIVTDFTISYNVIIVVYTDRKSPS